MNRVLLCVSVLALIGCSPTGGAKTTPPTQQKGAETTTQTPPAEGGGLPPTTVDPRDTTLAEPPVTSPAEPAPAPKPHRAGNIDELKKVFAKRMLDFEKHFAIAKKLTIEDVPHGEEIPFANCKSVQSQIEAAYPKNLGPFHVVLTKGSTYSEFCQTQSGQPVSGKRLFSSTQPMRNAFGLEAVRIVSTETNQNHLLGYSGKSIYLIDAAGKIIEERGARWKKTSAGTTKITSEYVHSFDKDQNVYKRQTEGEDEVLSFALKDGSLGPSMRYSRAKRDDEKRRITFNNLNLLPEKTWDEIVTHPLEIVFNKAIFRTGETLTNAPAIIQHLSLYTENGKEACADGFENLAAENVDYDAPAAKAKDGSCFNTW